MNSGIRTGLDKIGMVAGNLRWVRYVRREGGPVPLPDVPYGVSLPKPSQELVTTCLYINAVSLFDEGLRIYVSRTYSGITIGKVGSLGFLATQGDLQDPGRSEYMREARRREDQETTMLGLHLLQNSVAYVNTLMLKQVLAEPGWRNCLEAEDLRALTPLIYGHVNPYGRFDLDMNERLSLDLPEAA